MKYYKLNVFGVLMILFMSCQVFLIYRYLYTSIILKIITDRKPNVTSSIYEELTNEQNQIEKRYENIDQGFLLERIRREIKADEKYIIWWKERFHNSIDIMKRLPKEKYKLLLIVSTAPQRFDRRDMIRKTWWRRCEKTSEVKCLFFTDGILDDRSIRSRLLVENKLHEDIQVQPMRGGVNFGERFLYHLRWAVLAYEFEYFMRLDDDEFLCFDRLISDLRTFPTENFILSWIHCEENLVRPEESLIIISQDVVNKFVGQNESTMQCHPLADQQIGLWVKDLGLTNLYHHDRRIHHHPPASNMPELLQKTNICKDFLAIHGSYPNEMKYFWENKGDISIYPKHRLKPLYDDCMFKPVMNWNEFGEVWLFEPKTCKDKPVWNTSKLMGNNKKYYEGREEEEKVEPIDPQALEEELQKITSYLNQCEQQYAKLYQKHKKLLSNRPPTV